MCNIVTSVVRSSESVGVVITFKLRIHLYNESLVLISARVSFCKGMLAASDLNTSAAVKAFGVGVLLSSGEVATYVQDENS